MSPTPATGPTIWCDGTTLIAAGLPEAPTAVRDAVFGRLTDHGLDPHLVLAGLPILRDPIAHTVQWTGYDRVTNGRVVHTQGPPEGVDRSSWPAPFPDVVLAPVAPVAPPLTLADFATARLLELGEDEASSHLADALHTIVGAYRAASDPRTAQMAASAQAIGFCLAAVAEAWASHPDYDEAWRAGR